MSKAPVAPTVDVEDIADPLMSVEVEEEVQETDPNDPFELLKSGALGEAIQKIVNEKVAERIGSTGSPNTFVAPGQHATPSVPVVNYLKHYRNDSSPELEIVELDMSTENPAMNALPGKPTIKFRRGHFFATTENQVKQIEWMLAGAVGVPDAKSKFGGSVGIYEDSGETLYYCPYGCSAEQFVSASKTGLNAHLRAAHNMEI